MAEQEDEAKEFVDRFLEMRKNTPDIRRPNDVYSYLYTALALILIGLIIYI